MNIGVLSGKGGTGKTTVAVNLAKVLKSDYADCDVEEPNGEIFLKPIIHKREEVSMLVPKINNDRCLLCGKCIKHCNFNAMVKIKNQVLIFEEMCSGCGACSIICNNGAILNHRHRIGEIIQGSTDNGVFISGLLDIGESSGKRIIEGFLKKIDKEKITIFDCAPGVTDNVITVLEEVDFCIVVTEPTLFGLSDLEKTVKLLSIMDIPYALIINKSNKHDSLINEFCKENNINIIGRIPYDKNIAVKYSRGELIINNYEFRRIFERISKNIINELN